MPGRCLIVVPDGLSRNQTTGQATDEPSFVYRAVLDQVLALSDEYSAIFLAPANDFGGPLTEQEAAEVYLRKNNCPTKIYTPKFDVGSYIDTRGNAAYLKQYLTENGLWPLQASDLISASLHMPRARLCFKKEGYVINRCIAVNYSIPKAEFIVNRLWYYKSRHLHVIYEILAFMRDYLRPARVGLE